MSFNIFAGSEHCLYEEQLGLFDSATNYTFKCTAVSTFDNPAILLGKPAHRGCYTVLEKFNQ